MARRRRGDKVDGWLVLDKPLGLTSSTVVGRVRRLLNAQKVGHAGTLDPLASGILPIGLGEATKTMPFIVDATKEYEFTIRFGAETTTDDLEGDVTSDGGMIPTIDALQAAIPQFLGDIEQVPPAYSAIKVDGQRAYDLARAGQVVKLKSRTVSIHGLSLLDHDVEIGEATFRVCCGKGTYIRSLARDLARAVNSLGHVCHLRRTRVGPFDLGRAISLEKLESFSHSARAVELILPLMTALDDIPALAIDEGQAKKVKTGQSLPAVPALSGTVVLLVSDQPIALADADFEAIRPVRVFNL